MSSFKKSLIISSFLFSPTTFADYYGRFISGGFLSKEVFRNSQTDRYNDVSILSQRLFVNFDRILGSSSEFTVDIRDKHNFFEKLDNERLQLTGKNHLQVHQLQFHKTQSKGINYSLGRFSIIEAGSNYTDGLDFGFNNKKAGSTTKYSLFYGLNPEVNDGPESRLNVDSKRYGGYFVYENKGSEWKNYFYSTTAFVKETFKNETDRSYVYSNIMSQSVSGDTFSSLLYLDLVPSTYIQNLWMTYSSVFKNQYKLRTSLSTIDSVHYFRQRDVRETLASSRYHQASFSLRSPTHYNTASYETKLSGGKREIDNKSMTELKFASYLPRFIADDFSGTLRTGVRKNFISNDFMLGAGFLQTNTQREFSFNQDFQFEKEDQKKLNIVSITEGSYSRFFSRSLFGVFSLQNIYDSNVSIFSVLFKLSYRFGSGGQAPIRDGAAPMGSL